MAAFHLISYGRFWVITEVLFRSTVCIPLLKDELAKLFGDKEDWAPDIDLAYLYPLGFLQIQMASAARVFSSVRSSSHSLPALL